MDKKSRSAIKSIIWRIFGVAILAAITFAYTREWITTGLVTVIHHVTFLGVFYVHERLWLRVKRIQNLVHRSLLKMLTYETICGNVILGAITYGVTGDWKQMTAITLTYIGIKHICYIFNEFVWDRVKMGRVSVAVLTLLAFTAVPGSADYWGSNTLTLEGVRLNTEMRMDSDVYYRHLQLGYVHKLSDSITVAPALRGIYKGNGFEYNPMMDVTYGRGIVKNRSRVQLRMTNDGNRWRGRNKTTVSVQHTYAAYEAFYEGGEWFRNRYYVGVYVSDNLGVFLLCQEAHGEKIWVLGTNIMIGVLR